jgi:hypothetical protein
MRSCGKDERAVSYQLKPNGINYGYPGWKINPLLFRSGG